MVMVCSRASIQSQRPVLVLAFQRGRRHSLGDTTGLEGLNDVHRMGLVEGLHHLNAKAIVSAEGQHPSLVAMRVPGRQHLGA